MKESQAKKINLTKSHIYTGRGANNSRIELQCGITIKEMPFVYLGAPIIKGRKKAVYYEPLVEKVRSKLFRVEHQSYFSRRQMGANQKCAILHACVHPSSLLASIGRFLEN